ARNPWRCNIRSAERNGSGSGRTRPCPRSTNRQYELVPVATAFSVARLTVRSSLRRGIHSNFRVLFRIFCEPSRAGREHPPLLRPSAVRIADEERQEDHLLQSSAPGWSF